MEPVRWLERTGWAFGVRLVAGRVRYGMVLAIRSEHGIELQTSRYDRSAGLEFGGLELPSAKDFRPIHQLSQ